MHTFKRNSILFVLGALGLFAYLKSPSRKNRLPKAESPAAKNIEILPSPSTPDRVSPSAMIPSKRNQSLARMAIGGNSFKPTVNSNGMQIVFEFRPIGRSCQNGDIDLMKGVVGSDGNLLIVIEDSNNKRLVEKTISMGQLSSPLSIPLNLAVSDKFQVYRLSLCTDGRRDACSRLEPIDYKKLEASIVKNGGAADFKNQALFYTYSFGSLANGLHLFDGTKERQPQQYQNYVSVHAGTQSQFEFLKKNLDQERKLGVLPLQIEANRLVLPLYYSDKSRCEISLNKGAK